jgi:hypothetical protein
MGQRAVTAGIGVKRGAVEADCAKLAEPVGLGDLQDLYEERLERLAEAAAERGERVVVGVTVAGKVAKGNGVVGSHLDLATGKYAGGVAVDEQAHQAGGMVGIAAATGVGTFDAGEVETFNDVGDVARQVRFGQPVLYGGRKEVGAVRSIGRKRAMVINCEMNGRILRDQGT